MDVAPQLVSALAEVLAPLSIGVRSFSERSRLVETLRRSKSNPACILLASDLSSAYDRKILDRLTQAFEDLPVIVLADNVSSEIRDAASARGAVDVVESSMMATYICQRVLDVLDDPGELADVQQAMIELAGHANIIMRPIGADDALHEEKFLRQLAKSGISQDFFASEGRLSSMVAASRDNEKLAGPTALIAVLTTPGQEKIVGMARFGTTDHGDTASFGVATLKEWRGKGIGSQLLRGLIAMAALAGVQQLQGFVLKDNASMMSLARQLGFDISDSTDKPDACEVSKVLRQNKPAGHAAENFAQMSGQHPARRAWAKLAKTYRGVVAACRSAVHKLIDSNSNRTNST